MLTSVKLQRRQSEIRQELATLANKETLTEDETRSLENLDAEYVENERKLRASLIAEDTERREAQHELEGREGSQWDELLGQFEVRQIAMAFSEGAALSGATQEVVSEMRQHGSYSGIPCPIECLAPLERRAGETLAGGVPDPISTRPIIDRLFPQSVAAKMGVQLISVAQGQLEYPVVTSNVQAGWADGELAPVAGPESFTTVDKPLKPNHTFGITMKISRRSMKQSSGIESAVRRDMNAAVQTGLDRAIFQGTGANGQPSGVIAGAAGYGVIETAVDAAVSWSAFRGAVTRFMTANAVSSASAVRLLARPECWEAMDASLVSGTAVSEWDRLTKHVGEGNIALSSNALDAPAGSPAESAALLTTTAAGVPPIFAASWGGLDIVKDPFSDATSGALRLTALATLDCTISRPAQLEVLTGLQT